MTHPWADIVEREGAALADAAAGDPTATVPATPGWDAAALVRHLATVHARALVVLRTGTMERPTAENGLLPEVPGDDVAADEVIAWYRSNLVELVNALGAVDDPDRPVYSFAPGFERAGFWPRRMAHETTVHRVDAEQATGRHATPSDPAPIEAAFAADGVDELFEVVVPLVAGERSPGDGRTVHLHATDDGLAGEQGEWLIRFDPGGVTVERGHAKGDAAVRGPAADLYLWLWGRLPLERLELFGDADAAATLRALATR